MANTSIGQEHSVVSFDMNCVKCPNGKSNWWKFVLAAFLPLTIFYFVVLMFQINITSSRLYWLVFYSQCLVTPSIACFATNPVSFSLVPEVIPLRWYILHTFMDTFQGCYKDGTESGTRDCRWFISVYFLVRLLAILIGAVALNVAFLPIITMVSTLVAILFIQVQPFKSSVGYYSNITVMFSLLLAIWYVGYRTALMKKKHSLISSYIIMGISSSVITFFHILSIIIKWIYSQGKSMRRLYYAWRHGYDTLT